MHVHKHHFWLLSSFLYAVHSLPGVTSCHCLSNRQEVSGCVASCADMPVTGVPPCSFILCTRTHCTCTRTYIPTVCTYMYMQCTLWCLTLLCVILRTYVRISVGTAHYIHMYALMYIRMYIRTLAHALTSSYNLRMFTSAVVLTCSNIRVLTTLTLPSGVAHP